MFKEKQEVNPSNFSLPGEIHEMLRASEDETL
jgi:hypothetical protein